jgi:hypothetical protein
MPHAPLTDRRHCPNAAGVGTSSGQKGNGIVAPNLITELMNEFRSDTLNSVAATLGETAARDAQRAKASTTDQANTLFDLIKRQNLDTTPSPTQPAR